MLPREPALHLAVLTCYDARIDPLRILGLREGDAHILRNAGGVVTDDVGRSLLISQRLLGTEAVMVIQHVGCGMLAFSDDELLSAVERDTGVRPPFAPGAFCDLGQSVRDAIEAVRAMAFLPHRDDVRGFVYDLATGRLEEVEAATSEPPAPTPGTG